MNQNKSGDTPSQQSGRESEADRDKREAGKNEHSSHDHTAREKAGSKDGAGGGAKQKQQH